MGQLVSQTGAVGYARLYCAGTLKRSMTAAEEQRVRDAISGEKRFKDIAEARQFIRDVITNGGLTASEGLDQSDVPAGDEEPSVEQVQTEPEAVAH